MKLDSWLEIFAAALAGWALYKTLPRPPRLDWERLFKTSLATLLRGEVEAAGGDLEAWQAAVHGAVLYHPAGRLPEHKLLHPKDPAAAPPPWVDGEEALVGALAALEEPLARLRRLYVEDDRVTDALFADPAELGAAFDPASRLAPGLSWDAVAAWSPELQAALARRLDHLVVATFGAFDPAAFQSAIPGLPASDLQVEGGREVVVAALDLLIPRTEQRLLLLAQGPGAWPLLQVLAESPGLRDRVAAVAMVGAELGGRAEELAALFTHDNFDTELQREVPFLFIEELDPEDPKSWARLGDQRLPEPPPPPTGRRAIERIDLGPLVRARLGDPLLARALLLVLAYRLG